MTDPVAPLAQAAPPMPATPADRTPRFVAGRAQGAVRSFCLAAWGGLKQGVTRVDSTNGPNGLVRLPTFDINALELACEMLVTRHTVLNSRIEERAGAPWLIPLTEARPRLRVLDEGWDGSSAARQAAEREIGALVWSPFDVRTGPLYRFYLVRLSPDEAYFGLVTHHFVVDAMSIGILMGEFLALYGALARGLPPALPPPAVSYQDYLQTMTVWIETDAGRRLREAASTRLEAIAPVNFADRLDLSCREEESFQFDPIVAAKVRSTAQRLGASPFMILLAVQKVLLWAFSTDTKITLKVITHGRDLPLLMRTVGNLADRMYVMTDLSGDLDFAQTVERVKDALSWNRKHTFVRHDFIQSDLADRGASSAAPVFNFRAFKKVGPGGRPSEPAAVARPLQVPPSGLTRTRPGDAYYLEILDNGERMFGTIRYGAGRIDGFRDTFEAILIACCDDPTIKLSHCIGAAGWSLCRQD